MRHLTCMICVEGYDTERVVPLNFKNCGHTFCKECLIKSTREKPVCPVCRSIFLRYERGKISSARDMKENITISNIVRRLKRTTEQEAPPEPRKRSVQEPDESLFEGIVTKKKVENKVLIKVESRELLLPYLKSKVKIRLEPSLRESLRNFVVVQNLPYVSNPPIYHRVCSGRQNE